MRRSLKLGLLVLVGLGLGGCAWLFTPLKAVLTATPTSGTAPLSVTFSAAGSTGTIVSFTLDFDGDGTPDFSGTAADLPIPKSWQYNIAGTYHARLTVQDNRGRTDSASVVITVQPGTWASLSASPVSVPEGTPVTLILQAGVGTAPATWKLWYAYTAGADPDLQGTIAGPTFYHTVAHAYANAGSYTVRFEVKDAQNVVDAKQLQITVTSPPPEITTFSATFGATTVNFDDADPTLTIAPGNTVDFDLAAQAAAGRKITKYTLLCPNSTIPSATEEGLTGNTLTRNDILRTYNTAGTFTATLQVWDDVGNTDTATITIKVE